VARFRRSLGSYSLLHGLPSSGELEGDGPGAEAACTSNPSPHCFVSFIYRFSMLQWFFWMLQQIIFECYNRVIHVLQKWSSNIGIVAI
jgi:hypothetical protein